MLRAEDNKFLTESEAGTGMGELLRRFWIPVLLSEELPEADGEPIYRGLYANYGVADRPSYPNAEHPVVRTHPVTGKKALYVNRGFTRNINGVPRDESDAMLAYLYQHAENPLFQCRFRWTENAIAFWDNRCAQHRAMWDYWPHTRAGTRVTVKGERPV